MLRALSKFAAVLSCSALGCLEANAAELQLGARTQLQFAPVAQAREVLSTRDDFVARLSPFDRSARLKTDKPVDEATFLAFASDQAMQWTAEEQTSLTAAFESVKEKLQSLQLNLPDRIWLIKTTGLEEGGAAYTRGAAIIFPKSHLQGPHGKLQSLLCHELFHVLSRHDKTLRKRLYKAIGFEPCPELQMPTELGDRRLTNPDGPNNDHCIKIKVADEEDWAIPILYSKSATYDQAKGGEFFAYLVFKLIVIERPAEDGPTTTRMIDGQPVLIDPKDAVGYLDQVGRNTAYIIHPDEVLADNFVLIVTEQTNVPSPQILARIVSAFRPAPP